MFKTDDTIIKVCMFLAGLIFFLYGTVMMFNYDFMIDRYPTFEDNLTTEFFLNWFGAVNFVAYVGILYMGFKGLDRGFFAYAIPVVLLQLIWVFMSLQQSGGDNYTGLYAWIILSALLIISRIRAGFPFTYESAGNAFGVTDKVTQYMLYVAIILVVFNIASYFVDPGGFIRQVPLLESNPQAEHSVLGITMINIAILIAFIYQYRVGLSGVLITMSAVAATMFFSSLLVASVTFPNDGAPLLALFITLNFIISITVYFRNQSNF
jgi:hypothetical protein